MVKAFAITPWYERPLPLPFAFVGTTVFVEKLRIIEKREGVVIPFPVPYAPFPGTSEPAFFIWVMTQFGDLRLTVSKAVFDLLKTGDKIVVRYQRGRWTGALKGRIAN